MRNWWLSVRAKEAVCPTEPPRSTKCRAEGEANKELGCSELSTVSRTPSDGALAGQAASLAVPCAGRPVVQGRSWRPLRDMNSFQGGAGGKTAERFLLCAHQRDLPKHDEVREPQVPGRAVLRPVQR